MRTPQAPPKLSEIRDLQKGENISLGALTSRPLAEALAAQQRPSGVPAKFHWFSQPMRAKVNLTDKDSVYRAMGEP